jgi:hypothetical protein
VPIRWTALMYGFACNSICRNRVVHSRVTASFSTIYHITGTAASKSTMSRFFLGFFPFRGSLRKPNLTPYDKFKPENIARANEFILFIIKIAPHRLKFGDEKLLKGGDLFNRQVRRNPMTGEVPSVLTSLDFRNTDFVLSTSALVLCISLSTMVRMTQPRFLERLSAPLGTDS